MNQWKELPPTKAGWYWWKRDDIVGITEIRQFETGLYIHSPAHREAKWVPVVETIVDYWSDRIESPDEDKQVQDDG